MAEDPRQLLATAASAASDAQDRLRALRALREYLDRLEEDVVVAARLEGVPWQEIADALGRVKSWAWNRYGRTAGKPPARRRAR